MADKLGRKHDDAGHVISNDENDGQECKHQSNENKEETPKKDLDIFGVDYDEEFEDTSDEKISEALDDASWSVTQNTTVEQYAQEIANKLNVDKDKVLSVMNKEAGRELNYDEKMSKILGFDDEDDFGLEDAVKNADDDVLDEQFGKDTPERKLVGAMKGQPTGEATSDDEWNKRHQEFLERGKSTWNQKLQKGDKITIQDKNGNDVEVFVNGFWKNGELVDEDTYEEGKDNHWHDFRGVGIADKDGKNLGSINAYQIKKHSREQLNKEEDLSDEDLSKKAEEKLEEFKKRNDDSYKNLVDYLISKKFKSQEEANADEQYNKLYNQYEEDKENYIAVDSFIRNYKLKKLGGSWTGPDEEMRNGTKKALGIKGE